jgi:hypothetical protein
MTEETKTVKQGPYGTEVQIRVATVTLGDKDYEITEAPILRSRTWRERFYQTIAPLLEQLGGVKGAEFETPEDLLQLLPLAEQIVVNALTEVVDLLLLYSPELEADRDYILNHATERQAIRAFQEVLKLAIPFEIDRLIARNPGLLRAMTSSNSPSPNGDGGSKTPSA